MISDCFSGKCYDYFSQNNTQGIPGSFSIIPSVFSISGDENFNVPRVDYPTVQESSDKLLLHSVLLELANLTQKVKEDNIFLFIVRSITLLSNRFRAELASKTLVKVISALFKGFYTVKSPVVQSQLRVLIQQLTVTKFDKINLGLEFLHTQSINNIQKYLCFDSVVIQESQSQTPTKQPSIDSPLKEEPESPEVRELNEELQSKLKSKKITPIDLYCHAFLTNLFDEICLYQARCNEAGDQLETEMKGGNKEKNLSRMIIRSVPATFSFESAGYGNKLKKKIRNEVGQKNGFFGWCFVCRSPANFYCKETRVPICGASCKLKHLAEIERCGKFSQEQEQNRRYLEFLVEDACILVRKLEKYSNMDPRKKWRRDHRTHILILEILLEAFDSPGYYIRSKPELIASVKSSIFPALIRLCFSSDKETCRLSLSVFIILVKWFRVHLKSEFRVFVEEIFNRILVSGNSFYTHKILALHALQNLIQKPSFALEIFLNYDCDAEQKNIFENILALMCKIAQGMYTRVDYAASISETQEQDMKAIALDSIVNLVSNLHHIMFVKEVGDVLVEDENKSRQSPEAKDQMEEEMSEIVIRVSKNKMEEDNTPAKKPQIQRRTKGKNFEDLAESMNPQR